MRIFIMRREKDISGVSGVGVVAEGVEFHDKQCVLSWFSKYHSIEVHPSIEQVEAIHGHGGTTKVIWLDLKSLISILLSSVLKRSSSAEVSKSTD